MPQMLSFNTGAVTIQPPSARTQRNAPVRAAVTLRHRPPAFSSIGTTIEQSLTTAVGGQMTVGSILGFATGYAIKRIGQLLLVIVGSEIVVMQLMAQRGWIIVDWNRIGRELSPSVKEGGLDRVVDVVKFKVPFAGAFSAGCYAGFRWS